VVALENLSKGETIVVDGQEIILQDNVQQKHKFTGKDFKSGDRVHMYGVIVGKAMMDIPKGTVVTVNNVHHDTADNIDVSYRNLNWPKPDISKFANRTFMGYHRGDGQVGTQNVWIVVPLVFCENRNILKLKEIFSKSLGYTGKSEYEIDLNDLVKRYQSGASEPDLLTAEVIIKKEEIIQNRVFKNVDGIKFLVHDSGCGGTRQDAKVLCNLLAGYINNPNVAGATILSLGCQNAQIEMLKESLNTVSPKLDKPVYFLEQQEYKTEQALLSEATKKTFAGLAYANQFERKPASLSKITLGLECGGSDGFSGISANPVLGYASDLLTMVGGTPVLSEFPELNGVEQELSSRCVNEDEAKRFVDLMKAYNKRAQDAGSSFAANPSPGNIKDGLITDAMKSAGAAKKGGTSPVIKVLDYAEQVKPGGLNLLCTPGNDVESTTGLAGSGTNVIVFTTGLGTPTGNPVSPVIKMASNTHLYEKMHDIIDFNTGTVITGEDTIQTKGEELFDFIIKVASGEITTKAAWLEQDDFIPWKRDISL
jgi:altronate hydrolase